ncbi:MAG: hypothetical protein HQK96_10600 [Nitrospirae bacterium]|nr:hypothetical protein [Nitrospirota bacterium]
MHADAARLKKLLTSAEPELIVKGYLDEAEQLAYEVLKLQLTCPERKEITSMANGVIEKCEQERTKMRESVKLDSDEEGEKVPAFADNGGEKTPNVLGILTRHGESKFAMHRNN